MLPHLGFTCIDDDLLRFLEQMCTYTLFCQLVEMIGESGFEDATTLGGVYVHVTA